MPNAVANYSSSFNRMISYTHKNPVSFQTHLVDKHYTTLTHNYIKEHSSDAN